MVYIGRKKDGEKCEYAVAETLEELDKRLNR